MNGKRTAISLVLCLVLVLGGVNAVAASMPAVTPTATLLAGGLAIGSGSTIGPGGALFVTDSGAGTISRVDPRSGAVSLFASGLPPALIHTGGPMDVAFLDGTAYALVTLVGADIGGSDIVGIYRVDGPTSFTVIADLGAYSMAHPPSTPYFVPTGVPYSIQTYRGGFLVADGHHNRVLRVTLDGAISEVIAFGNIVPTGLAVRGDTIYLAEAGPVPHLPETGRVVSFGPNSSSATVVAAGARLLVDVEFGLGQTMYGLSQGIHTSGIEGTPADPNTGALMRVNGDGTFSSVIGGLDRPTSLEIIGTTAYVVTYGGEIWKIEGIGGPPYGGSQ